MATNRLFNYSLILSVSLLLCTFCNAQRQRDTARVVILICDTSSKSQSPYEVAWRFAYSVRELHNNTEGFTDPYAAFGFKYKEYWIHLYFINEDKKELPKDWTVWQSVLAK